MMTKKNVKCNSKTETGRDFGIEYVAKVQMSYADC